MKISIFKKFGVSFKNSAPNARHLQAESRKRAFFMDSRQLSKDDRETLELELKNSTNVRQKKILTGTLASIGGLMFTVIFYYLNLGRIGAAITLVSFIIMTYGLFNIASWTMFSKSIKKLKYDFDNGFKFVGQHKIKSYNFLTKKVKLDNGMKLDSFEINNEWNTGDELHIEILPTSNFIIRCDKTLR